MATIALKPPLSPLMSERASHWFQTHTQTSECLGTWDFFFKKTQKNMMTCETSHKPSLPSQAPNNNSLPSKINKTRQFCLVLVVICLRGTQCKGPRGTNIKNISSQGSPHPLLLQSASSLLLLIEKYLTRPKILRIATPKALSADIPHSSFFPFFSPKGRKKEVVVGGGGDQ